MKLELTLGIPSALDKHNCMSRDENDCVSISSPRSVRLLQNPTKPEFHKAQHLDADFQVI